MNFTVCACMQCITPGDDHEGWVYACVTMTCNQFILVTAALWIALQNLCTDQGACGILLFVVLAYVSWIEILPWQVPVWLLAL